MLFVLLTAPCSHAAETGLKRHSVFYPARLIENARKNMGQYDWARQIRDGVVEQAHPWIGLSDEQLWGLMFGPTITRSWMVWSDGHCPACKKPVPMYNWEMDAMERPWKTRCPHCREIFPKNDFGKFYSSGLDQHGVFDTERADRSLLFNQEHPDPSDPLHKFGVDDGEGYVDGDKRWRFIGAYLVYGQWKQAVLGGIKKLAAAYVVTSDKRYAHKAAVMLDRVADLYPTFDFKKQALLYESVRGSGYVSVWHDACEETRELALAYDQIFEGIEGDQELARFLRAKAKQFAPANPKNSVSDIRANIETRILRDALTNTAKISSNYPRTPIAIAIMKAILKWPHNREEVFGIIDGFLKRATAVDGVTGEKGLANYSAFGLQSIALFLGEWDRAIPGFLDEVYQRQPRLRDMFRFHIDTWCFTSYYPLSGDTGWFARKIDQYQGVRFLRPDGESGYSHKDGTLSPSIGQYNTSVETWIPRIMVRRRSEKAPLASTFVSVIEPYGDKSRIASTRRLPLYDADGVQYPDPNVAIEIAFCDGSRDLLIAADVENPLGLEPTAASKGAKLIQPDWKLQLEGELCVVRKDKAGKIKWIALCRAGSIAAADVRMELKGIQEYMEIVFDEQGRRVVAGSADGVRKGW